MEKHVPPLRQGLRLHISRVSQNLPENPLWQEQVVFS